VNASLKASANKKIKRIFLNVCLPFTLKDQIF
jgi:hypothetical protein